MKLKNKKTAVKKIKKITAKKPSPIIKNLCGDIVGLLGIALAIYTVLCLISFVMEDPSWSRSTSTNTEVHNLGGQVGAYLSDILYYFFGASAWWFIIGTFVITLQYFISNYRQKSQDDGFHVAWAVFGLITILFSSPIIEFLIFKTHLLTALPHGAGGILGQHFAKIIQNLIGFAGSFILSLLLFITGISFLTQKSWFVFIEKIGAKIEWLWLKLIKKPHEFIEDAPPEKIVRRMIKKPSPTEAAKPVAKDNNKPAETKIIIPKQKDLLDDDCVNKTDNDCKDLLPHLNLLSPITNDKKVEVDPEILQLNAERIESKLAEFGVQAMVVSATHGPVITRYEIEPAQGVKGSQIVNLNRDLARALSMQSIRIVETIAGKHTMGVELPNDDRQNVLLNEILASKVFNQTESPLTIALGKDIGGAPVVTDLAKMPHLLVAGTTGSGKSVAVNAMIISILFKATPEDVRMIMIDPKMLELSVYQDIPHLLAPVVTDMKQAANALNWCVNEMEKRYRLLSHLNVRNIAGFNQKIAESIEKEQRIANPFSLTPDNPEYLEKMPYIVIIIDELADLMMVEGKKVEQQIARIAQKARAAGMHLVLATQRPSVDVITGLIKANIPTRISFQVSSKIDSRTILDQMGAEQLLGKGDMLFLPPGTSEPTRLHGAFVTDAEVLSVAAYLKRNGQPRYIEGLLTGESALDKQNAINQEHQDELFDQAVEFVLSTRKTSISSLQRHLRIGYNRAANLMENLEQAGIVSPAEIGGSRQILARKDN